MLTLGGLHVGRPTMVDGVSVFPVWTQDRAVRGLDTGSAARVRVNERSGQGTVAELVVTNEGSRPVLLLEGELLEGGLQHRALVGDLILAPGQSYVAEVACVEQGRWAGGNTHARRARRASAGIRVGLRQEAAGRQQQVWSRVAEYGSSPTQSLLDHLDRGGPHGTRVLVLDGQRGVVIGVGGLPLVLELFASTKALTEHLPGLIAGARLDAATVPAGIAPAAPGWRARAMAAHLDGLRLVPDPRPAGDGRAVRACTRNADARGIALDGGPLAHLSVLNIRHPLMETSCI